MNYNLLQSDKKRWIIRIVSCLLLFILMNLFLVFYFGGKEAGFYNARNGLRMKYFNPYELDAAVTRVAQDKGHKVVVIGDSFVWGTGVNEDQTFSAELQKFLDGRLSGKKYTVYNLAIPASNAADVYGVLKKVGPLNPDLIILNTNYFFFSVAERLVHMNYPWLTASFKDESDSQKTLPKLNVITTEYKIGEIVRKVIPLYRYREEINIKLLGSNKPQAVFSNVLNSLILKIRYKFGLEQDWKPQADDKTAESLAWAYSPDPVTPDRANYIYSDKIAVYLKDNHLNSAVFVTPHNAKVVGRFMAAEGFKANSKIITNIFTRYSLPVFEYENRLDDRLQADHIHLSPEGSKEFAKLLGKDIIPLLKKMEDK